MGKEGFTKITAWIIALSLLAGMAVAMGIPVPVYAAENTENFAGGDGSVDNPFRVETAEHLNNVRNHLSSHFIQTENIDLSSYNWVPIGTRDNQFIGSYDGNFRQYQI